MEIEQVKVGFMDVFCYIISCENTKEALVIDPAGDEDYLVEKIREKGFDLKYIVNTHGHPDHTGGNARVKELTGAEIVMHEEDDKLFNSQEGRNHAAQMGFAPSPDADLHVKDNDEIVIGDVKLKVIHTPGHSRGGICLYGDGNLFAGDTLFVGAIGRTDLPGGDYEEYMDSINKKLMTLPEDTVLWPGHDYGMKPSSTIGYEKNTNPFV
ncbi:MBL fold metallo-hydrolase [Thermodesulfobacteriota bacterium]